MIGFPYDYGDELTVEESFERLTGISKIFIKGFARGFAAGFVVYGASKIVTLPAFAEDTHASDNSCVPAKPESTPKVSPAETGALSASSLKPLYSRLGFTLSYITLLSLVSTLKSTIKALSEHI